MKMVVENINEAVDINKVKKIYDSLKKGDEITITYDTAISKGINKTFKVVKDKTKVGSGNVERITLANVSNPTGMKYYFYNRGGRISFATGDMAAIITNITESNQLSNENIVNEELSKSDLYFIEKLQREWVKATYDISYNLRQYSDTTWAKHKREDYLSKVHEANGKRISIEKELVDVIYKMTKIKLTEGISESFFNEGVLDKIKSFLGGSIPVDKDTMKVIIKDAGVAVIKKFPLATGPVFRTIEIVEKEINSGNIKNVNTLKDRFNDELVKQIKIDKGIDESVNEGVNEPEIITQLRDVIKSGYKSLKDPKSGKKMKVDSYSASAIVKVYDALNDTNKKKFSELGLLGMQNVAFKVINK